jgi:hypothetical protein
MGGHPYWYFVPYESDAQHALDTLRDREFKAGRYNPVIPFLEFSEPGFLAQQPGPKHRSIDDAVGASSEDGTRSILDIAQVGEEPDFGVAAPVPAARLREWFGTEHPTHAMLTKANELFESIDRGHCVYVIVYEGDQPKELFAAPLPGRPRRPSSSHGNRATREDRRACTDGSQERARRRRIGAQRQAGGS